MKAWAKSLEKPAVEFSETQLTLLSGKIPDNKVNCVSENSTAGFSRDFAQAFIDLFFFSDYIV